MQDKPMPTEAREALDDVLDAMHDFEDAPDRDVLATAIGTDADDRLLRIVERAVETLDAFAAEGRTRRSEVVARDDDADPDPASFGPFFVQYAPDGWPWETWTVVHDRAEAETIAKGFGGARVEEAVVTPGDAKALLAGQLRAKQLKRPDPPVGGPVSTRIVSLVELLVEPREELHRAVSTLLTSDYERKLRLGGDLGRTIAYMTARHDHTPTVDDVEQLVERLLLETSKHGRDALALVELGLDLAETMPPIANVRDVVDEVRARLAGDDAIEEAGS